MSPWGRGADGSSRSGRNLPPKKLYLSQAHTLLEGVSICRLQLGMLPLQRCGGPGLQQVPPCSEFSAPSLVFCFPAASLSLFSPGERVRFCFSFHLPPCSVYPEQSFFFALNTRTFQFSCSSPIYPFFLPFLQPFLLIAMDICTVLWILDSISHALSDFVLLIPLEHKTLAKRSCCFTDEETEAPQVE